MNNYILAYITRQQLIKKRGGGANGSGPESDKTSPKRGVVLAPTRFYVKIDIETKKHVSCNLSDIDKGSVAKIKDLQPHKTQFFFALHKRKYNVLHLS